MIKEDYVSFEVAKLLKEKGFPQEYDIYHSMVYNEEDYEDEYEVQRMVLQTRPVKAGTLSSYPVSVPEPKCYCPTHQMAMKWLRGKGIYFSLVPFIENVGWPKDTWHINFYNSDGIIGGGFPVEGYENAVEAAIKYCLENLI